MVSYLAAHPTGIVATVSPRMTPFVMVTASEISNGAPALTLDRSSPGPLGSAGLMMIPLAAPSAVAAFRALHSPTQEEGRSVRAELPVAS